MYSDSVGINEQIIRSMDKYTGVSSRLIKDNMKEGHNTVTLADIYSSDDNRIFHSMRDLLAPVTTSSDAAYTIAKEENLSKVQTMIEQQYKLIGIGGS